MVKFDNLTTQRDGTIVFYLGQCPVARETVGGGGEKKRIEVISNVDILMRQLRLPESRANERNKPEPRYTELEETA